jgi:hypothetical protein
MSIIIKKKLTSSTRFTNNPILKTSKNLVKSLIFKNKKENKRRKNWMKYKRN